MARYAYLYVSHTHFYNCSPPPYYLTTAVLNDCYSEVTAYMALAYSYWASFHDVYGCLRHAHYFYWASFHDAYGCKNITPINPLITRRILKLRFCNN